MVCGQSLFIPPLFDGTNYVYWNVCMKAFLQVVEVGWKKPTEPFATQDDGKIKDANFKSMALNALFNGVTNKELKKILSTKIAK